MKKQLNLVFLPILLLIFILTSGIFAHCDGLDGPVVKAAIKSIETENVNLALIWVQEEYDNEIKNAFEKTLLVRKLSPEAKEMADMYFFETLVRLHRMGEGAPYTGLKPAGRDLGPAIPLADKSIEKNSAKDLLKLLSDEVHNGLHHYFQEVMSKKNYDPNDVEAGREFIEAYVVFVHYAEGLYETAKISAGIHHNEAEETELHKH